ncbi:S-layer homology domain-containing protein [Paenibacillus sp. FSL H8-0079]|uniref:S-layer homology domain-containing protein n=1 Tax=Paenibacillus sp. FSL H8-0079 TaxID=2921375 RepID=UPI0030EE4C9B
MSTRFRASRKVTSIILVMLMVLGGWNGLFDRGNQVSAASGVEFAGGKGTSNEPYLIETAAQLDEVRWHLGNNIHFKLTADIDLSGYAEGEGWEPIGNVYSLFYGNLDGNGFKISNLTINRPQSTGVGLFGEISSPGSITNIGLEDIDIVGAREVGGLAGRSSGTITSSFTTGSIRAAIDGVGGLVGYNSGVIRNSYSNVSVEARQYAGGLVGVNYSRIYNSYVSGTVNADYLPGGLVSNSYDIVQDSFYDSDTTRQNDTGKGIGKQTSEMKNPSTYANWDDVYWGFNPDVNEGYPYLKAFYREVNYDGNGNTGGDAPIDSKPYSKNATVTVSVATDSLVKTDYAFGGWNTLASGSGTSYVPADTFLITENTTLYAQWLSTKATLTSGIGMVSTGGTATETITNIPGDVTLEEFKAAITLAANATFEIYEADGTTVATTLANGYKVIVTAEDGMTQVTYTLTVIAPPTPPSGGGNGGSTPPPSGGGNGGSTPPPSGGGGGVSAPAPSSGGGNSGSTPAQAPGKVTSTNGSLTLPVGTPGEVSLEDGLTITVPAGAVNQELKITMTKLLDTTNVVVNQEVFASRVFEVLKNVPGKFTKPVTLTFAFDASLVKSGQRAGIFYFDEVNKVWVEVQGSKTSGNSIAVEVDHFTKFAVLVVGSATEIPGTTPAESEVSVSDIAGHWAEAQIKQAIQDGIVNGYTDGTFKPSTTITRAEFTVMLINTLNTQEAGAELAFTDQAKIGTWAQAAVAQAVQAGIINGYTDGTFQPNANITRAEMATMIGKAFELSLDGSAVTSFADDEAIPAWAKHAVATLQARGVVQGTGANTFNPRAQTTRAEAVVMLLNMLNVAEGQNVQ